MDTISKEEWAALSANLREPFAPEDIDFRPGATTRDGKKALALAYVTSRAVQDRLDRLVGAANWSFSYMPLAISNDVLRLAKGVLMIYGVTREDIGEASRTSPSLGCVSHSFKRVAVQFGMGRDLYDLPQEWVPLDEHSRFTPQTIAELRRKLPRPKTHTAQAQDGRDERDEQAPVFTATPRQEETGAPAPTVPATPAPPMRQRSDAPGRQDERAHTQQGVTFPEFLKLVDELGFTQSEAMKQLGVRSLSGLNLDEALGKLEALAGVAPIAEAMGLEVTSVAPAPENETPTPASYPDDIRADGTADMALAQFLQECAALGYKGNGALARIQEALGVRDLIGVSYTKALKKLAGAKVNEPAPKRQTAGAAKSAAQEKNEPGGGANGRAALRRLALEAGIAEDDYLAEYYMLFDHDFSHENEVAWREYLEQKKAQLQAPIPFNLKALKTGAPGN